MRSLSALRGLLLILSPFLFASASGAAPRLIAEQVAKPDSLAIPYQMYRLENGLTVILHPDHSDPLVHVNVTYHVGSAREVQGHLFHIPVYGAIPAGVPAQQEQQAEETLAIDPAFFGVKRARPADFWALRVQGELQLFDDPEVLEYPWDLSPYDANPSLEDLKLFGAAQAHIQGANHEGGGKQ